MPVERFYDALVVVHPEADVHSLFHITQALFADAFEPDESEHAAGLGGKTEQLFVVRGVYGRLHPPPFFQALPYHPFEKLLCPFFALRGVAHEVVVEEEEVPALYLIELIEHVARFPLPIRGAQVSGNAAELAIERAPPRGLDGLEEVAGVQEIPPWLDGKSSQIHAGAGVDAGHAAVLEVLDNLAPDPLRLSNYDGIRETQGLIGQHGGMDPSDHHFCAGVSKQGGNFVSPVDGARKGGDPDQVCLLKADLAEDFVRNPNLPVRGSDGGKIGETQRLQCGKPAEEEAASSSHRVDQEKPLHFLLTGFRGSGALPSPFRIDRKGTPVNVRALKSAQRLKACPEPRTCGSISLRQP